MYGCRTVLERRVYELNTAARKIRLQSAMSLVEQTVVPVVKSKCTEVRWLNIYLDQGLHRLENYLNLEGFLEKSLKLK